MGGWGGGLLTSFEPRYRKDVVALIFVVAYRRGGWGEAINVLRTALQERCCYVDDVAMLMTLLR